MAAGYTVATVRAAEAELMARLPEGELMARAAAGLAATCTGLLARGRGGVYGATVLVLAGPGDNGGDALHAGALLARRGARVEAVAAFPRWHAGGAAALVRAGGRLHRWSDLDPAGWSGLLRSAAVVLDGLLGIGGSPGPAPAGRGDRRGPGRRSGACGRGGPAQRHRPGHR